MSGSPAEERIRAKVVAEMRRRWPGARIVHELVLEQGGVRLDVAAVAPDFLAVAEIKSERDVLKRTRAQIACAVERADEVWFVFAQHHAAAVRGRLLPYYIDQEPDPTRRSRLVPNPDRIEELRRCQLFVEHEDRAELIRWADGGGQTWPDPRTRFQLLWADEMRSALGRHFGGASLPVSSKLTRPYMARQAVEHMSGREVRRAVCVALRNRPFPRADKPVSEQEAEHAA